MGGAPREGPAGSEGWPNSSMDQYASALFEGTRPLRMRKPTEGQLSFDGSQLTFTCRPPLNLELGTAVRSLPLLASLIHVGFFLLDVRRSLPQTNKSVLVMVFC